MDIFDKMCFTISSAGGRRGAQMGTFDVGHPDVMDFIRAKRENGRLRQFNLSLLITDEFMQFRVTPRQGEPIDIVASIKSGRDENGVAKDVRDAFAAKLSPERYTVEVDDGEDVLIKKKDGQPDFALELIESDVRNVNIKVEGE